MHRAGGLFYMVALVAALALCAPRAQAVPVTSLYVVVVPGSDPVQAAQAAMRVELVRLVGTRDAASDPALAMLIDNARQYVQLERSTTAGQMQVLFDEGALSAAIGTAGRTLWGSDRPLLWIELPPLAAATTAALRMRLSAAADERGLPIMIVGTDAAPAPATAQAPAPAPSAAPPSAPAVDSPAAAQNPLEAARSAGASAALVARVEPSQPSQPSQPGTLVWTLFSPDTGGQWVGSPELAIDAATDALASATRTLAQGPLAQYDCQVNGVSDLDGLVNVLAVVNAAPGVTQVAVSEVQGDQLVLHLQARGSEPQLQRALASERLQPAGTGPQGELLYRYLAAPTAAAPAPAPPSAPAAAAAATGAASSPGAPRLGAGAATR
jgi:Uncharacterized protein conserved in bacteria (DUF2066)